MSEYVSPYENPEVDQALDDLLRRVEAKGGVWSRDDSRLATRYLKRSREHFEQVSARPKSTRTQKDMP